MVDVRDRHGEGMAPEEEMGIGVGRKRGYADTFSDDAEDASGGHVKRACVDEIRPTLSGRVVYGGGYVDMETHSDTGENIDTENTDKQGAKTEDPDTKDIDTNVDNALPAAPLNSTKPSEKAKRRCVVM